MPLFVFTHTLISFFLVLSWVVGVACGAGADTGPLSRMSPNSVAARIRKYLTGSSSCGLGTPGEAAALLGANRVQLLLQIGRQLHFRPGLHRDLFRPVLIA